MSVLHFSLILIFHLFSVDLQHQSIDTVTAGIQFEVTDPYKKINSAKGDAFPMQSLLPVNNPVFDDPELDIRDPVDMIWERLEWTNPQINFLPGDRHINAGDLNGDGLNDMIRIYTTPDERDDDLSSFTGKTLMFFGGNNSTDPDEIIYRHTYVAGDLTGDGLANLIAVGLPEANESDQLLKFGETGYSIETITYSDEIHRSYILSTHLPPADYDLNGKDDFVRLSNLTLGILFSGDNPFDDFELVQYNLRLIPGLIETGSSSDYALKSSFVRDGKTYILFRYTNRFTNRGNYLAVLGINEERQMEIIQNFKLTDFNLNNQSYMFPVVIAGTQHQALVYVNAALRNSNAEGNASIAYLIKPDDITESLFSEQLIPLYDEHLWHTGDLNADGVSDFIVMNRNDSYHYYYATLSEAGDQLIPGDKLPFQEELRYLNLPVGVQVTFGDQNGDGTDDYYISLSGTEVDGKQSHGMLFIQGDESRYNSFEELPVVYHISDYERIRREQVYALGDVTGNGFDDFAVFKSYSSGERDNELILHEGGSNWNAPYHSWPIETGNKVEDMVSGNFSSRSRMDLVVLVTGRELTGYINSELRVYQGGASPVTLPFATITPGQYVNNTDLNESSNFFGIIENAGDINNSGYDDLLISTPQKSGSDYTAGIYYGGSSFAIGPVNRFVEVGGEGPIGGSLYGATLKGLGDISGDGIDDFAVVNADETHLEYHSEYGSRGIGRIHIYYGKNTGNPNFSEPDLTLKSDSVLLSQNGDFMFHGLNEIAVARFTNPDSPQVIAKPLRHYSMNSVADGIPAIHIYDIQDGDSQPDDLIPIRSEYVSSEDPEFPWIGSMGRMMMAGVPDINDDGFDELLIISSVGYNNAVLYYGGEELDDRAGIIFRPESTRFHMGASNVVENRQYRTPIGDFNGDGTLNYLTVQPIEPNFRDTPLYLYELGQSDNSNHNAGTQPAEIVLHQNYPNPFNPETRISYSLMITSKVELEVYDIMGRKLATLVNAELPAGEYQILFDASQFASGMYIYRIKTDTFSRSLKMLYIK